ncbi:MAG TPA: hypothetical protein VIT62_16875 [Lysobacter sp.]
MQELTQREIDAVAGGGMPQCHASDPAPYSTRQFNFGEYLQFYLMVR